MANSAAQLRAYIEKLEKEYNPITQTPANKRSAFQKKRLPDLQRALNIARNQLTQLNKPPANHGQPPPPDPNTIWGANNPYWQALVANASQYGVEVNELNTYLGSLVQGNQTAADINTTATTYLSNYRDFKAALTPDVIAQYKTIYGVDLSQTNYGSLFNNSLLNQWITKSGQFYTNYNNLSGNYTSYQQLSGTGSWQGGVDQLGYNQFRELASMFGTAAPTQSEFAQLKAPNSTYQYQGKTWDDWNQRYESWRSQRQTLYTEEGASTSYSKQDGFAATGLKSQQEY